MTQKGVYPYDYMDSFERFNETQLPSKDDFFSQLTEDAIKRDTITRLNYYLQIQTAFVMK